MMIKERFTDKKITSLLSKVFLFIMITILLTAGVVLAKYTMEKENEGLYIAENFYLDSDLLSASADDVPEYILQSGVDDIVFKLRNYPDELRVSEVDIKCKALLTAPDGSVTGKDIELQKLDKDSENVVFNNLTPGTYSVLVKTISPYKYELNAKFTVTGLDNELKYTVSDSAGSPNLLVTIETTDYNGEIIISWPENVYPDITDPLLVDAAGTNTTVTMKANSEYSFQFFKEDPSNDYKEDITVQKGK